MSDHIKREERSRTFTEIADDLNDLVSELNDKIVELVKSQSADVAPVRHGRWVDGERMPMYDIKGILSWGNWYTCNQCEFKTNAIEGHITQYRYCPNCGAKMDEETK